MANETKTDAVPVFGWRKQLWLLFGIALVLRIISLGKADLWCDEILFINLSAPPQSPFDVWANLWRSFLGIGHFPVPCVIQNVFMWLVRPIAGDAAAGEFVVRLPAVMFGAACAPMLARLGSLVAGRMAGLVAGIVYATFLYPVFFAREAYFYAPLVFFTLSGLYCVFSIASSETITRPLLMKILAVLALGAASLSHVSGILISAALLLVGLGWFVKLPAGKTRNQIGMVMLLALLGAIPALPFYFKRLTQGSPMNFATPFSYGTILSDGIGKQFFGTHPVALAVACALLVAGAIACIITRDERRHLRIGLLAVALIAGAFVVIGARSSLYYSRYFNVVNGPLYLLVACGLSLIPLRSKHAPLFAGGALALLHVALFLPSMYALPAKGVNYGGIARWLNANLKPGTPYVLESGYEMRFISDPENRGHFQTPQLVSACPYIHGDIKILWERQQRFFEQFPDAVYVESAHHGAEPASKTGIFQWPRQHFKNKVDIRNEPLARLARMGIWPQAVDETTEMVQSLSSIYFNKPADNEAAAKVAGAPVTIDYPGWRISQIQQFEYARVIESSRGTITIHNSSAGEIAGQIFVPIALYAPDIKYQIDLLWQGHVVGSLPVSGGRLQTLQAGPLKLPPGNNELQIRVGQGDVSQVRALIVPAIRFVSANAAETSLPPR